MIVFIFTEFPSVLDNTNKTASKYFANVVQENVLSSSQMNFLETPSTAPLPIKFPIKHESSLKNSIKSAPNLPSNIKNNCVVNKMCIDKLNQASKLELVGKSEIVKRRTTLEPDRILKLKKLHRRILPKGKTFSSSESVITSISCGSMESLKSSTSEGNRSTSSTDSRHSSTLSSHSSDSGKSNRNIGAIVSNIINTKLKILSPISDKSIQDPISETTDINKNTEIQLEKERNNYLEDTNNTKTRCTIKNKTLQLITGMYN